MEKKIFLSVGKTSTKEQEAFVKAVEDFLQSHGLIPQTLGRTFFSSIQPLKAVDDLMRQCCGVVIAAFERIQIEKGVEKRGSPEEHPLENAALPTVWNQIEAAMAYTLGHPLLVIIERGLRSEGLLERGYDWYVNWVDLSRAALNEREFQGVFSDWKCRVDEFYKELQENPDRHRLSVPLPERGRAMAKTILVLAANPKNTPQLRLDQEVREITNGLRGAKKEFNLKQMWAARPVDVRRAMLDDKPSIVHFCGHGSGEEGIAFEDENGQAILVSTDALSGFFELFADKVDCVVLNACYSETQAEAIVKHIPRVIGMKRDIGDAAAIEFAVAFYDALGAGESIEFAHKLACNAIQWAGIPEHLTPVLKLKAQGS
jgi:hypothetical protein